jgi:hypothetical protein
VRLVLRVLKTTASCELLYNLSTLGIKLYYFFFNLRIFAFFLFEVYTQGFVHVHAIAAERSGIAPATHSWRPRPHRNDIGVIISATRLLPLRLFRRTTRVLQLSLDAGLQHERRDDATRVWEPNASQGRHNRERSQVEQL